ncbi:MAG: Gfo/Idh/MocA family oxidoreductase [Deltaproteobacteria bacterium]|nr:Gfo/Idh/MocA family oxidoreductase [Deltaproteobacteria bacterium]
MRSSEEKLRFGVVGGGWINDVHLRALALVRDVEVAAIADYRRDRGGRPGRAKALGEKYRIAAHFDDHRRLLEDPAIDVVLIGLPNCLHAEVVLAALDAGKHVVIEKPMCLSLDDADRIVAGATAKGLRVGYAEELCFCPKLVRTKELVSKGAVGRPFLVKQLEAHAGPYSDWFFTPELAGGGALLDMGCHSIELARWMFDKPRIKAVTARLATFVHVDRPGPLEDHVVVQLDFEGGRSAIVEAGWCLEGGMESVARVQGTEGVLDVDLLRGNGLKLFTRSGVLGEDLPPGWHVPDFDWLVSNGYPAEMSEFASAIREGRAPSESAEDGRVVLEVCWAAYVSAAEGRTVSLPFTPDPRWRFPAEPWLAASRGVS